MNIISAETGDATISLLNSERIYVVIKNNKITRNSYKSIEFSKKELGLSEKAKKEIELDLDLATFHTEKEEQVINALLRKVDAHLDCEDDKELFA